MIAKLARLLVATVFAASLATGCTKSAQSNAAKQPQMSATTAKTILAFQRMESLTETGITRADYIRELGELNFALKQYGSSAENEGNQTLTAHLEEAAHWYGAAAELWTDATYIRCATYGMELYLCMTYPELLDKKDSKGDPMSLLTSEVVAEAWGKASAALRRAVRETR